MFIVLNMTYLLITHVSNKRFCPCEVYAWKDIYTVYMKIVDTEITVFMTGAVSKYILTYTYILL